MPRVYKPATYIYRKLRSGSWLGLEADVNTQKISCSAGEVLSLDNEVYTLTFHAFNARNRRYYEERKTYKSISFPSTLKINDYLYFRGDTGNYKLSNEGVFKGLVNPKNNKVEKLIVSDSELDEILYEASGKTLAIPMHKFKEAMAVSQDINKKTGSYAGSVKNYLSNRESVRFSKDAKAATTSFNVGEMKFSVDRLNLPAKRNKASLGKYLGLEDISSLEALVDKMLRLEMFSEDFIRKINDYFIKEKLQDIVAIGREILALGTTDLTTIKAQQVTQKVGYSFSGKGSLEALWQEFFRKYLLFLIFSYKKIFPKIELNDVDGDKKYPDFIGINHYNGLDVIEIKTHLATALNWDSSHKNFYFSAEISKAIIQSKNYMDSIIRERFKDSADKRKITQSTEKENLYHPRSIIIVSSFGKLTSHTGEEDKLRRDFTKLRNGLNDIEILTFDEILDIADEYITNISSDDLP